MIRRESEAKERKKNTPKPVYFDHNRKKKFRSILWPPIGSYISYLCGGGACRNARVCLRPIVTGAQRRYHAIVSAHRRTECARVSARFWVDFNSSACICVRVFSTFKSAIRLHSGAQLLNTRARSQQQFIRLVEYHRARALRMLRIFDGIRIAYCSVHVAV